MSRINFVEKLDPNDNYNWMVCEEIIIKYWNNFLPKDTIYIPFKIGDTNLKVLGRNYED